MTKQVCRSKSSIILRRVLAKSAVLLVFALVFVAPAAAADTYYVSSDVQGEAGTGSESDPYSLENAIKVADVNGETIILLADGDYSIQHYFTIYDPKNLTFKGSRDAKISLQEFHVYYSNITFDGLTVVFPDTGDGYGLAHTTKVVYENCLIKGQQYMYAEVAEFIGCTLENRENAYCVWTYEASNANDNQVTFTSCTFNTGGKAVLVYNHATTGSCISKITLTNCVFNDDNSQDVVKAAVETGIVSGSENEYYITINSCTVNGFAVNNDGYSTGSTLWGNKNRMDYEYLIVTIDGVEVTAPYVDMDSITLNDKVYDGVALTRSGEAIVSTYCTEIKDANGDSYPFTYAWYKKDESGDYVPMNENEAPKDVGEYKLVATVKDGVSINRLKSSSNSTYVNITKKDIIVTPDNSLKKVYGDADTELTYTYSGYIDGETPKFDDKLSRDMGEDVGAYKITKGNLELANNETGNFQASNYELKLDPTDVFFTIEERPITVTPDALTKVYGDADPELTYTYSGDIQSETPNFKGDLGRAVGEDVGDYLINSGNLELDDNPTGNFKASNYKLKFDDQTEVFFTITPKQDDDDDDPITPNVPDTPRGSSIWLTETPTPTPTPTETIPTETPTVIPTEDETKGVSYIHWIIAVLGVLAVLLIIIIVVKRRSDDGEE